MNNRRHRRALPLCLLTLLTALVIQPAALGGAPGAGQYDLPPRNVILMVADGMGYNHADAAWLYASDRSGAQVYRQFPHQYAVSTYAFGTPGYDPEHWARKDFQYPKNYPTDSAAAGTALATGVKTKPDTIGMGPDKLTVLENAVERAKREGKSAGVVTSVYFTDATPAAFVAHESKRGDLASVAHQMLFVSELDVLMGCGHPWYDADGNARATPIFTEIGNADIWQALENGAAGADGDGLPDPWTLIQTREAFQALQTGVAPKRVCGIAQVARTLQKERSGDPYAHPFVVPPISTVPTLSEMALGALNVLAANPEGFFLMVEGGAVDWASHDHLSGRMIEEMLDFDQAVAAVASWVEAHSNWDETLLVVTADHETGYLWGPWSNPDWRPLVDYGPRHLPGMTWHHAYHTNSLVPLYAKGAGAEALSALADQTDPMRGAYLDNAELGGLLLDLLVAPTCAPTPEPTALPTPVFELALPLVHDYRTAFAPVMHH